MFGKIILYRDPFVAGGIFDSIVNPLMQWRTNVENRKFSREMYKTQRGDALADWAMQNAYNSPMAQMQRFKDAGLNPHLIYGQGNVAQPVRSASASQGNASAPQFDVSSKIAQAYDIKMRNVQIDQMAESTKNLIKQRDVMDADIISKLKGVGLTDARIGEIMQNMEQKKTLFPHQLESVQLSNQKVSQDIDIAWQRNFRDALLNESNLEKQAEEIASLIKGREKTQADIDKIKQEINLMRKDGTLKDIEIKWRNTGQNPYNPQQLKLIDGILERLGYDTKGGTFVDELNELRELRKAKQKPPGFYRQNTSTWQATDSR